MRTLPLWLCAICIPIAASAAAQTLDPAEAGTIRKFPEMGLFESIGGPNPGSDFIQSSYFRTTEQNREFRRGIVEFNVPATRIRQATLILAETRGTTATPVPPDLHHVIAYTPADLSITTEDYDRAGAAVGTFSTDGNEEQAVFVFDVTSLVTAAAGGTLGFRVQLDADPEHGDHGFLGSGFRVTLGILTSPLAVGLEVRPDPLEASSNERWVTAYLEPPYPIAAADIDVASIRLNGIVPVASSAPNYLEDHDGDGVVARIVNFDRRAVELTLPERGERVEVTVTGMVNSEPFTGTDVITVHRRRLSAAVTSLEIHGLTPNPASGGRLRVEFTLPDPGPARIELIDVAGRVVISKPLRLGPGRHAVDVTNGRLAPGMYFLRLSQNGREAWSRAAVIH